MPDINHLTLFNADARLRYQVKFGQLSYSSIWLPRTLLWMAPSPAIWWFGTFCPLLPQNTLFFSSIFFCRSIWHESVRTSFCFLTFCRVKFPRPFQSISDKHTSCYWHGVMREVPAVLLLLFCSQKLWWLSSALFANSRVDAVLTKTFRLTHVVVVFSISPTRWKRGPSHPVIRLNVWHPKTPPPMQYIII